MAWAINLLYGAHGRQVHDAMLEAYQQALSGATDYQLDRAADYLLRRHRGDFPPTASQVLCEAKKYRPTEQAEAARLEHNRRCLAKALEHRPNDQDQKM